MPNTEKDYIVEETYVPSTSKKSSSLKKPIVNHDFFPPVIKLKIDDEFYLEVDLLDYFERLNRQGWSCSKVKKIGE